MTTPAQPSIAGFFSGGSKSFSWKDKPIGTTISGVIKQVHPPVQATDPVDGSLVFNKKTNKPKMQVRIELQTSERDPQEPEDDGVRSLWVGGWMQGAVGDALRKAGAQEPQVGGTLTVRLIERQPNDNPALQAINKFDAHYVPAPVTAGFFGGEPQNGLAPLGQPQQPIPQPNIAGTGYVQQPVAQAPVQQQAPALAPLGAPPAQQPVQQPLPQQAPQGTNAPVVKPPEMNQLAWDSMDPATQQAVANTFASLPPF